MRHPIIYRVVFYSCFLSLVAAFLFVLSLIQEAPFTSKDMRNAYLDGCNIGLHSTLTTESVMRCARIADMYKETLDDLDKQMELINEHSK